jgi:hypothetical protein
MPKTEEEQRQYKREYMRQYVRNMTEDELQVYRQKGIEQTRQKRESRNELINSMKTECANCGLTTKAALQFHHTDPSTKLFSISTAKNAVSVQKLLDEIAKCIVLCANCHLILHNAG